MMPLPVAGMFFVGPRVKVFASSATSVLSFRCSFPAFVVLFRSLVAHCCCVVSTAISMFVLWCAVTCIWSIDLALSAHHRWSTRCSPWVAIAAPVALPLTDLVESLILSFQWIIALLHSRACGAVIVRDLPPTLCERPPAGILLLGGRAIIRGRPDSASR